MLSDREELEKIKTLEKDYSVGNLFTQLAILEWNDDEKLKFHKYIKNISQNLLGDSVNLDDENVVFLLSKDKTANAASVHTNNDKKFIFVTKGLLDLCENEAQLAFILGHELQHWLYRKDLTLAECKEYDRKERANTKAEEASCDLLSIEKMQVAGYDIEEANKISHKLFVGGRSNIFSVINEHPLSENRLKALWLQVKRIREELIEKGEYKKIPAIELYNPDISKYEYNELEQFFQQEKYLNANYDEKVKLWFSVFDKLSEGPAKISDKDIDILHKEQLKWKQPKNNYTFEEMYYDRILAPRTLSDFSIVEHNLKYLDYNAFIPQHKPFMQKFKEHFVNFRESTGEETKLYCAKLGVFKGHFDRDLIRAIFNLSDDERKNIGIHFSTDVLEAISKYKLAHGSVGKVKSANEVVRDDLYFSPNIIKNKDFSSMIYIDNDLYLLDKSNQVMQRFGSKEELKNINIAQEYNDFFEFYEKLQRAEIPLTQKHVKEVLRFYKQIHSIEKQKFNKIKKYLSSQSMNYFSNIFKSSSSWNENVADIVCKYMKKDDKTIEESASYESFIRHDVFGSLYSNWKFPEQKKLLDVYFQTGGKRFPREVHLVTEELLKRHLKAGKSIDDFVFPYDKQFYDFNERFLNNPSLRGDYDPFLSNNLSYYTFFELLKKNPKIDLSQIANKYGDAKNADSYLSAYIPHELKERDTYSDEIEIPTEIYNRLYANITNLDNWGDGNTKISELPYYKRVEGVLFNPNLLIDDKSNQIRIDTLRNHYSKASIDDRIESLVPILEYLTIKSSHGDMFNVGNWEYYRQDLENKDIPLEKRLQFASKIRTKPDNEIALSIQNVLWREIQEKIASPDLSITEKTRLFNYIAKIEFLDTDKSKYFETLLGKDGKSGLLGEINSHPQKEFSFYIDILDKENRIPDPKIRSKVIQLAVQQFVGENGNYNDITASDKERETFIFQVQQIKELIKSRLSIVDEHEFLRNLANTTLSQQKLSQVIKPDPAEVDIRDNKVIKTAYALDSITYLLDKKILDRNTIVEYILSEGKRDDTQKIMDMVQNYREKDVYRAANLVWGNDPLSQINEGVFISAKKEFDNAPLPAQACIMTYLAEGCNWEHQFKVVSDKLFEQTGELGEISKKFLKSYISSRPDSERHLYLSAMFSASQNKSKIMDNDTDSKHTKEERSVAEGLRLFLENSGPAGVKLGQAMSSYAGIPDFIKDEMQKTKSSANPPARWEVFDWLEQTNQTEALKHGKLGKLLGSASFFVTYDMLGNSGKDSVIKINRRGSANKAEVEFGIYKDTLNKLQADFPQISAFKRLVDNAAEMVKVETDLEIGEEQLRYAQTLYPEKVNIDGRELNVEVMNWSSRGDTWAIMDKASGKDFHDLLPENKKTIAKAVVTMEFANMLSGQRFDSDRHSGQYKIDENTNTIGIFDTGSISIVEAKDKEKRVLGVVLANTVRNLGGSNGNLGDILCAEIEKAVNVHYSEEIKQEKSIPPFLSEFQRGLLALTDFHKELNGKEIAVCMLNAMNFNGKKLDKEIYNGFVDTIKTNDAESNKLDVAVKIADTMIGNDAQDEQNKFYQQKGREVVQQLVDDNENSPTVSKIQKLLKTGGVYDVLTNFSELKNDKVETLIGSKVAMIQFSKGIMKQLVEEINPERYSPIERQQIGEILYKVNNEVSKNQILHKDENICDTFLRVVENEPNLGVYATKLKKMAQFAVHSNIGNIVSNEDFSKAIILGRLLDSEVQKGYSHLQQQNSKNGYFKNITNRVNVFNMVPRNVVKSVAKFAIKEVAPYYMRNRNSQANIKPKSRDYE